MTRLAWALAAVALLVVLGTTATAVLQRHSDPVGDPVVTDPTPPPVYVSSTRSPSGSPSAVPSITTPPLGAFDPETVLAGQASDNAQFEVPRTRAWTRARSDVGFHDDGVGADARMAVVSQPALFGAGFCSQRGFRGLTRAFVGFTNTGTSQTPEQSNASVAASWVDLVAFDADTGRTLAHSAIATSPITLESGAKGVRADADIEVAQPSRCSPPRVHLTIESLDTGDGVANLVMVRAIGTSGVLDVTTAQSILGSLQVRHPPAS